MRRLRLTLGRMAGLLGHARADEDLSEELASHLALLEHDLRLQGLPPAEAHRQARLRLGVSRTEHATRDARTLPSLEQIWQNIRQSGRSLRRAPVFTLASVLTLAIGIGATTTVFSVVNVSLLQPLPYPDDQRLVALASGGRGAFAGQEIYALRERLQSVHPVAWHGGVRNWNMHVGGRTASVTGGLVSAAFFDALGVVPRLGRTFTQSEDMPNGPPVVILSDRLWRSALGARLDVVGTTMSLGGAAYEIVGVMPAGFRTFPGDADLWTPLRLPATDQGTNQTVVSRLRDGMTLEQARAELSTVALALAAESGLPAEAVGRLTWTSYRDSLGQPYRLILTILLAAVGCVLLVACVNVAGLQLVRGTLRRVEIATRAAIGGGPRRLMMETLTESLILSAAGAAIGVIGALWALPRTAAQLPPALLDGRSPTLEPLVLAVVLVVAVGTGLVFGYLPARDARRVDVRTAMGTAGRQTTAAATLRWRRVFAAGQIALALILLVGAGLLGRTLLALHRVDLGFDPGGLVMGRMSLTGTPDPGGLDVADFYERTLDRIRATPGVLGATVTSSVPVERAINLPIAPPAGSLIDQPRAVDWRYVSSGFFEMLGVPVLDGRPFDANDTSTSPPVVIVNQALARAYFGDEPAVGRTVRLAFGNADEMEIVGVVADLRNASGAGWVGSGHALKQAPAPGMFVPAAQGHALIGGFGFDAHWLVRSQTAPAAMAPTIADIVQAAEPRLPFVGFRSMDEVIGGQIAQERALFTLLALFAGIAVVLACVGTYGMMAYSVNARSRDIGIRMALGATASRVLTLCLHEGLVVVTAGALVGLAGALVVARGIRAYVWGMEPFDPVTFGAVVLVLGTVVMVAAAVPAVRAARLHPARVLRQE